MLTERLPLASAIVQKHIVRFLELGVPVTEMRALSVLLSSVVAESMFAEAWGDLVESSHLSLDCDATESR